MSTYLVTGGAGFIGANLIRHLTRNPEHRIVVLDDLSTGKPWNIPDLQSVRLVHGDLADRSFLREAVRAHPADYVIHLAAVASVEASYEQFARVHAVNSGAFVQLLSALIDVGKPRRLLLASSAAVYGDHPDLPCREDDPCTPLSPYGLDKYACEVYLREIGGRYGIPYTIARFFNVYGPMQDPSSPYSGVISIFARKFMDEAHPRLRIFGDGEQTRDFVYVDDLVRVIDELLIDSRAENQLLNLGTSRQTSILDLVRHLAEIQGRSCDIEFHPARAGDIRASYADTSRLAALGLSADTGIREGLAKYLGLEVALRNGGSLHA